MKNSHQFIKFILICFVLTGPVVQAVEVVDQKGAFKSKVMQGKIYSDRGKYTGMITPEGKMYDETGEFTGQIKNQSILNPDGSTKGIIRDGKIYDQDGNYKGQLK